MKILKKAENKRKMKISRAKHGFYGDKWVFTELTIREICGIIFTQQGKPRSLEESEEENTYEIYH